MHFRAQDRSNQCWFCLFEELQVIDLYIKKWNFLHYSSGCALQSVQLMCCVKQLESEIPAFRRRLIIPSTASCQLGVSSGMLTGKWRSNLWKGFHLCDISADGEVTLIQWQSSGASTQFLPNRIFNPAAEQHRSSNGDGVCSRVLPLLPALREQKRGPQAVVLQAVNTGTGLWPLLG